MKVSMEIPKRLVDEAKEGGQMQSNFRPIRLRP